MTHTARFCVKPQSGTASNECGSTGSDVGRAGTPECRVPPTLQPSTRPDEFRSLVQGVGTAVLQIQPSTMRPPFWSCALMPTPGPTGSVVPRAPGTSLKRPRTGSDQDGVDDNTIVVGIPAEPQARTTSPGFLLTRRPTPVRPPTSPVVGIVTLSPAGAKAHVGPQRPTPTHSTLTSAGAFKGGQAETTSPKPATTQTHQPNPIHLPNGQIKCGVPGCHKVYDRPYQLGIHAKSHLPGGSSRLKVPVKVPVATRATELHQAT